MHCMHKKPVSSGTHPRGTHASHGTEHSGTDSAQQRPEACRRHTGGSTPDRARHADRVSGTARSAPCRALCGCPRHTAQSRAARGKVLCGPGPYSLEPSNQRHTRVLLRAAKALPAGAQRWGSRGAGSRALTPQHPARPAAAAPPRHTRRAPAAPTQAGSTPWKAADFKK